MDSVIQMKNDLLQSSFCVAKERDFNPNCQLAMTELTDKFDCEPTFKEFRKRYDFLNYLNYCEDYEIKLHIGKSALFDEKTKASNELLKHK
jgi:hypothetical protein